jgi:hypothetical protein
MASIFSEDFLLAYSFSASKLVAVNAAMKIKSTETVLELVAYLIKSSHNSAVYVITAFFL